MPRTQPTPPHRDRSGISDEIARSWFLLSATKNLLFDRLLESPADRVVVDLEDGVSAELKESARDDLFDWLDAGGSVWVRVNDRTTRFWKDDVAGLAELPGVEGVMLAKVESAEQVEETAAILGRGTPIVALVESAVGIENANEIARARGVSRLAFGSGDYRHDTGTSAEALAMAYPRSRLVVASRVGQLPGPIDGPTIGSSSGDLREQTVLALAHGLTGKLCLDISQLSTINATMSPTVADVLWAREFLDEFESRGRHILDGSDLPRLGRARKISELAATFGILPTSTP